MNIRNPREYCEHFLTIRDKSSRLAMLRFKPAQERLYGIFREEHDAGRPVRLVILKARQLGFSTLTEGLFFADTATHSNVFTLIMAHQEDATAHLFAMNKLFYDALPAKIKPMLKNSNAQELVFENPTRDPAEKAANPGLRSRIRCVTAGSRGAGRSFTLRNVHLSEVAFWPKFLETLDGILQAVPDDPDTCVVIESTAKGYNEFKTFWDDAVSGKNGFRAVFFPWYEDPAYVRDVAPGTEWTPDEKDMAERYDLTPEQLSWRRWCIKANCHGDENVFRQEYPSNPDEAFLFTGTPFFDNAAIAALRQTAPEPAHIGRFEYDEAPDGRPTNIRWVEDARGFIKIWDTPAERVPYVIGGDTAGEGSDKFTAFVIDNRTGMQAAELRHTFSERLYARQMYCLGQYYNHAMLAVETNFSTYPQLMLEEWQYPNLYQRQRYDTQKKRYVNAYGFRTDRITRPLILAGLRTVMDETPETVRSFETLGEMLTFVYNDDYRPEASPGEHDDLVMAAAICHFARGQQSHIQAAEPEERRQKLIEKYKPVSRRKGRT